LNCKTTLDVAKVDFTNKLPKTKLASDVENQVILPVTAIKQEVCIFISENVKKAGVNQKADIVIRSIKRNITVVLTAATVTLAVTKKNV